MADACTVVIFGATGDLAKRKLLPAVFNLASREALRDGFKVVGVGRKPMTDEAYREKVRQDLSEFSPGPLDETLWEWLAPRLFYDHQTLADLASYQSLRERLESLGAPRRHGRHRPAAWCGRPARGVFPRQLAARDPGEAVRPRSRIRAGLEPSVAV
jgi:glucose-6-phosphate 1-dehydrogenase